ncbi:hypothetical protein F8O01_08245 [Pseudoclavibacter chungangensis]|uniref:Uncharacterized protein n=1 Tax=Pseudoclavibacter chungangensis TaxID=587635 RepID=A0A7J5BNA2_9MICO|nr:hypothetical protein [Pseudoclavibacter chungangensis]KAB1653403.1 hypothetical protein F8O01_15100 [Pseudoclavibacter chungangensis]KAB1657233.1 hypothetical protein F8O01_08245 [Pseudoclavibacter chungangensis]NYJ66332.1 hypothetical protein [Pseudoclavibacter chungangensis]
MSSPQPWGPAVPVAAQHPSAVPPAVRGGSLLVGCVLALVWSIVSLGFGVIGVGYLVLGVTMTHTLDGVFGPEPGGVFNWVVLWLCLVEPLAGLVTSICLMVGAIRARRQQRTGRGAVGFGIAAVTVFGLGVLISLPLVPILFDALAL